MERFLARSALPIALVLWSPAGLACPALAEGVRQAWAQFDDAEIDDARSSLRAAYQSLECQTGVVPPQELLQLYRLDALVSLALDDAKGAVYATIRAVAADHSGGAPPVDYGPKLAELYAAWSERLSDSLIEITVSGGGKVWIDGRPLDVSHPLAVAQGEHLVQVLDQGALVSEVHDLTDDVQIDTEDPLPDGFVPAPRPAAAAPRPLAAPAPDPPAPGPRRRRPTGLLVGGVVSLAAGGGALVAGWLAERQFLEDPYQDAGFDGCARGSTCYAGARREAIDADAARIRGLYVGGYSATALGAGLVGAGLIGLPAHAGPRGLALRATF